MDSIKKYEELMKTKLDPFYHGIGGVGGMLGIDSATSTSSTTLTGSSTAGATLNGISTGGYILGTSGNTFSNQDYTWELHGADRNISDPFTGKRSNYRGAPSSAEFLFDLLCTIQGRDKIKDKIEHLHEVIKDEIISNPGKALSLMARPITFSSALNKAFESEVTWETAIRADQESSKQFNKEQTLLNNMANRLFNPATTEVVLFSLEDRKNLMNQYNEIDKAVELLSSKNKGDINIGIALLRS